MPQSESQSAPQPYFSSLQSRGRLIAKLLAGSWSHSPGPATAAENISEAELLAVTPLLYQSGAAALAWWRIRESALNSSPAGRLLHDAYRQLRLAARVHEREIGKVFSLLRAEGIEPVLVKGWAIARRYPDPALRPYGDIDLCVRPDKYEQATAALKCLESVDGHFVDLHDGFAHIGMRSRGGRHASEILGADLCVRPPFHTQARPDNSNRAHTRVRPCKPDATWDELFERSQLVPLGGDQIRVLGDEDHLRIICLHLLRSGAWRPLWLCDVAVALETRRPDFAWDICLGRDPRQAEWIAATIALARQLLSVPPALADVGDQRSEVSTQTGGLALPPAVCRLPSASWFLSSALRHWGRVRPADERAMPLGRLLLGGVPAGRLIGELYARWDNPVRATVALGGRFNAWPRLPYQLAEVVVRSPELPRQLAAIIKSKLGKRSPSQRGFSPVTAVGERKYYERQVETN